MLGVKLVLYFVAFFKAARGDEFKTCSVAAFAPAAKIAGEAITSVQFQFTYDKSANQLSAGDAITLTITGTTPFADVAAAAISTASPCSASSATFDTTDTCATALTAKTLVITLAANAATGANGLVVFTVTVATAALGVFGAGGEATTFSLTKTTTAATTIAASCTNVAMWTTVAASFTSTSLTPTSGTTGATIGQTVFTFTPTGVLALANPVVITFSSTAGTNFNAFSSGGGGADVSFLNAADGVIGGTITPTYGATTISLAFNADIPASTGAMKITIPTTKMGTYGTATHTCDLTLSYSTWATAVATMTSNAAAAVSDPITFNEAGEKVKYWLPREGFSILFETPGIKVLASPMQGPTEDLQWMGTFKVVTGDGKPVITVSAKRGNATTTSGKTFEQLEVTLGAESAPLPSFQSTAFEVNGGPGKVELVIDRRPHNPPRTHGSSFFEFVQVQTEHISFFMAASHAGNEFANDVELQKEYTHMDFFVMDIASDKRSGITGLLPELWGWKTMTNESKAMLVPPSKQRACSGDVCVLPQS